MIIRKVDPFTGISHSLDLNITLDQYNQWQGGTYIQDAMPHLTPSQREFLMTGIWDDTWEELFPEDEEDLEEEKKDYNNVDKYKFDNDLEKLIWERNRSKIDSILNKRRD